MENKHYKKRNLSKIIHFHFNEQNQFCPNESCKNNSSAIDNFYYKKGYFISKKNGKTQRLKCKECGRTFSEQNFKTTFKEIKPHLNKQIYLMYSSGVSLRRIGKLLDCGKNTVTRKFYKLAEIAELVHKNEFKKIQNGNKKVNVIELDEMETYENTKLKPVSIILAVDSEFRVLDFNTARMSAKGKIARKSIKIYGKIKSEVNTKILETLRCV